MYKQCINELLVNDTTLSLDNPLKFRTEFN